MYTTAHTCVQSAQHRAVLIIFPLSIKTTTAAQMMSIGEQRDCKTVEKPHLKGLQ